MTHSRGTGAVFGVASSFTSTSLLLSESDFFCFLSLSDPEPELALGGMPTSFVMALSLEVVLGAASVDVAQLLDGSSRPFEMACAHGSGRTNIWS
jgi:hypothetical protein